MFDNVNMFNFPFFFLIILIISTLFEKGSKNTTLFKSFEILISVCK